MILIIPKKIVNIAFGFSILVTAISCSEGKAVTTGNTSISGVISGVTNEYLILDHLGNRAATTIDTISIDESGGFTQKLDVEYSGFYRIRSSDQNYMNFILSKGDVISVNGDIQDLGASTIDGSGQTDAYHAFLTKLMDFQVVSDSIGRTIQMAQATQNAQQFGLGQMELEKLKQEYRVFVQEFINENQGKVVSVVGLSKLNPEEDLPLFTTTVDALGANEPNSVYYQAFKDQLSELSKLSIGSVAPEIALPSPSGEIIALSSLRGKYVLLDFWASWCKPCRAENPNVVRVYSKYKNKGFEILSVSLDKQKPQWQLAIQKDQMDWLHISDLNAWQSSVVPLYNVKGIPLTFLIDPDGKIVAKNLRGASLEQKLAEIFG